MSNGSFVLERLNIDKYVKSEYNEEELLEILI